MEVIDLDTWLDDYATRRYGAESESANQAWDILKETVYKASLKRPWTGCAGVSCKCKTESYDRGGFYMGQRGDQL